MMRHYIVLLYVAVVAAPIASRSAAAAETCWTMGASQFAEGIAFCTSSVLHPMGQATYGPERMADGNRATAWCAPATNDSVWIELRIDRGAKFQRLLLQNGYGKSPEVYRNNSRLKTIEISTDKGRSGSVVLPDRHELVTIELPGTENYRVVNIRIIDVYPGEKYGDICLGYLMPDFEYEETHRQAPLEQGPSRKAGSTEGIRLPTLKSPELIR
jgi:hypothetical protein